MKKTNDPFPNESYDRALAELQQLVRELESNNNGIDQLEEQVKRASSLIAFCRDKLRQTESAIEKSW